MRGDSMLRISPGREKEFRYFQEWLAASAALEEIIDATEADVDGGSPRGNASTDNALSRLIGSVIVTPRLESAGQPFATAFSQAGRGRNTMWVHLYVAEKIRELDEEPLARIRIAELRKLESRRPPVFGRVAAGSGRAMRRVGEALELWATPANEREVVRVALARARSSD